jgi:hypothetical protein
MPHTNVFSYSSAVLRISFSVGSIAVFNDLTSSLLLYYLNAIPSIPFAKDGI